MFYRKLKYWIPLVLTAVLAAACTSGLQGESPTAAEPTEITPVEETQPPTEPAPDPTETPLPPTDTAVTEPTPGDREPVIAVNPLAVSVGGEVKISGQHFPGEAQVEVGIGRVNSEYDLVETAVTDEEGSLETALTIPEFVEPEDRWVIVVTAEDSRIKVFSEELNITG